jgi:hypothetical protein
MNARTKKRAGFALAARRNQLQQSREQRVFRLPAGKAVAISLVFVAVLLGGSISVAVGKESSDDVKCVAKDGEMSCTEGITVEPPPPPPPPTSISGPPRAPRTPPGGGSGDGDSGDRDRFSSRLGEGAAGALGSVGRIAGAIVCGSDKACLDAYWKGQDEADRAREKAEREEAARKAEAERKAREEAERKRFEELKAEYEKCVANAGETEPACKARGVVFCGAASAVAKSRFPWPNADKAVAAACGASYIYACNPASIVTYCGGVRQCRSSGGTREECDGSLSRVWKGGWIGESPWPDEEP